MALLSSVPQKFGRIDVVVSNDAANPSVDPILQTEESILDKLWDINVKTSILLLSALLCNLFSSVPSTQDAAPHLQKGYSVIHVSSIAGYSPQGSMSMHGVTKTALLGLTKALAAGMAPDTRVNCLSPGFVRTHFADYLNKNDAIRKSIERTLVNRLGTTEDMASVAAFLASDDASYVTEETLVVAGGIPSRL